MKFIVIIFLLIASAQFVPPASGKVAQSKGSDAKVVVITGAASGFGRGVALKLAHRDVNLVLADRNMEGLSQVGQQCGGTTLAIKTDVTNLHEVEQLKQAALDKFGKIDVWINDAGIGAIGRFTDVPAADQAKVIETNLVGVIYGSHCAVSQFEKQKRGTLVNVSSIAGKIPVAYYSAYSASKLAVAGLDRALGAELKQERLRDIHVCTVYPMPTDTPFWNHLANYSGHTPQPPMLHQPGAVIDAIANLVDRPRDEVVMGKTGKLACHLYTHHQHLVERVAANAIYKKQIRTAAPSAPSTDGEIVDPMPGSDSVSGGVADRMKGEREAQSVKQ